MQTDSEVEKGVGEVEILVVGELQNFLGLLSSWLLVQRFRKYTSAIN
jgi:hypothetical protein